MTGEARRPGALIASACRWASTVELAKALSSVGFEVGVLAPANHPIERAPVACRRLVLSSFRPARSLVAAITTFAPDIIIPADETIVLLLHELHRRNPAFRDLIERSLGAPENYGKTLSRVELGEIARAEGIAAAPSLRLASEHDLSLSLEQLGLPAYIKIDALWGGAGVVRVETAENCAKAYRRLSSFLGLSRVAWRVVIHQDTTRLPLRRASLDVSMQPAIAGVPANCAVVAWRGELLASVEAVALETLGPTGSSTVIRVLHDQPMRDTCRRIIKRLGLSGLIGFDFILEATGRAVLIELNARATQTCHLRLGPGADLPEALRAAVTEEPVRDMPSMVRGDVIELFPQGRAPSGDVIQVESPARAV